MINASSHIVQRMPERHVIFSDWDANENRFDHGS